METPFKNDPFALTYLAFKVLYPDKVLEIWWGMPEDAESQTYGVTIFPDDGSAPQVFISPDYAVSQQVEILAHELAHVAVGPEHEHDAVWDSAFEAIHQEYEKIITDMWREYGR